MVARPRRLVLIGGGPSSAAVVLRMAQQVRSAELAEPFEIVLIDPSGDCRGGDLHGCGVHPALLMNDNVAELDHSGIGFTDWMRRHSDRWTNELASNGDPRVDRWLARNRQAIQAGDLGSLFIPRAVFGSFIREEFAHARRELEGRGISITIVSSTVTGVRPADAGWAVSIADEPGVLLADAVLVAIGSLPPPRLSVADHPSYFSYENARQVAETDRRLQALLESRSVGERRVVVIGSSAAASEVLACLEGGSAAGGLEEICVVSPSGRLADGLPTTRPAPFECTQLASLANAEHAEHTSAGVVEALRADVLAGRESGYSIVDILPVLSPLFQLLFNALTPVEKRRFVESDFLIYRELVRHTSSDYAAAADRLRVRGLLRVQRSAVVALSSDDDRWIDVRAEHGGGPPSTQRAAAVFDCRGFVGVHRTPHPVVVTLLASGAVSANRSGHGFDVNERFEAADGLFVLGPLLAGTSREQTHIWSLENIPHIYRFAKPIAAHLLDRFGRTRSTVPRAASDRAARVAASA